MPKYKTPASKRKSAFLRQLGRCYYCRQPMWLTDLESFRLQLGLSDGQARQLKCTAEHLTARCAGGSDSSANVVAACMSCNYRRHKRPNPPDPETYRQHVLRRVSAGRWHGQELLQKLNTRARGLISKELRGETGASSATPGWPGERRIAHRPREEEAVGTARAGG
jgi:hypothetical protein